MIVFNGGAAGGGILAQDVLVRGSENNQLGYEVDGVPVNRAFDNYGGTSLSTLGNQEVQVYTGQGPPGSATQNVGGLINQVIKTGTYPGFSDAEFGIGGPAYYHKAQLEVGGATSNRNFSYYAGVSGYDQAFRYFDQFNGGSGLVSNVPGRGVTFGNVYTSYGQGPLPLCVNGALNPAPLTGGLNPGCLNYAVPPEADLAATAADREAVANVHIGLPHPHDGNKDDIQLLYQGSYVHQYFYNGVGDLGGIAGVAVAAGVPGTRPAINYQDGVVFPDGTNFGQVVTPSLHSVPYFYPSSPQDRPTDSPIPLTQRDGQNNDAQIFKAQYQHNMGSNAYLRLYGYTLYSGWLQNGPIGAATAYGGQLGVGTAFLAYPSPDYELSTHTRGASLEFADQISSKNQLNVDFNYTHATVVRFNNKTFLNSDNTPATNLVSFGSNGSFTCYDYATGSPDYCDDSHARGTYGDPMRTAACAADAAKGTPCAATPAGAQWVVTNTGPTGTLNRVRPTFLSGAITDDFKPTEKLDINGGLRVEQFNYDLANTTGADYNFWFAAARQEFCYDPASGQPVTTLLAPGQPAPAPVFIGLTCPVSSTGRPTVHPDGLDGHILYTNIGPNSVTRSTLEPRLGLTYSVDPNTVLRLDAGQAVQPFNTAYVEYLNAAAGGASSAAARFNFGNFFGYGYNTPVHELNPTLVTNVDFSVEHRFAGTDAQIKVSPFHKYYANQEFQLTLGPNFASAFPGGNETVNGVEVALQKGDPARNGLSAQLSYTYTQASVKFFNLANGSNPIDVLNSFVKGYNALTAKGGGAPCYAPEGYTNGTGGPPASAYPGCTVAGGKITVDPAGITQGVVINPYYFNPSQPTLDRNASYPDYLSFPGDAPDASTSAIYPHVIAGFVQYKHDRFAITPSVQLYSGNSYGSPTAVVGYDPRTCGANAGGFPAGATDFLGNTAAPIPGANPGQANYVSCGSAVTNNGNLAIPNPETGHFDGVGQYVEPWTFNFNTALSYQFTPKTTATLTLANIVNSCFGGSKTPWSTAFPPGSQICGYTTNGFYVSNFFNGSSPDDPVNGAKALPINRHPYGPTSNPFLPFSAYLNFSLKL